MNKTYSLDVVEFINEVKKHRQIWDMNDEHYKTRKKVSKVGVWKDVAKVLIPDYESMNQTEKLKISRKLYSKWRNMKDSHIRMLRKNIASEMTTHPLMDRPRVRKKNTAYIYAKHLSFINSQYNFNPGKISTADERKLKYDTFTISVPRASESDSTNCNSGTSEDDKLSIKGRESSINSQAIEFVDTPVPSLEVNFSNNLEQVDADCSFFDSTLPAVREFNIDQKLEFRCEVLKLINSIRLDTKYL